MIAHVNVPGRLRGLASTVLIANEIYWEDPEISPTTIGRDVYKGISKDENQVIRKTWTKLAEIKVKETTDEFAKKGTQISWSLFYTVEMGEENRPVQHAWFVQMSHRQDITSDSDYNDEHPSDIH